MCQPLPASHATKNALAVSAIDDKPFLCKIRHGRLLAHQTAGLIFRAVGVDDFVCD
jgi:hypothetical protein